VTPHSLVTTIDIVYQKVKPRSLVTTIDIVYQTVKPQFLVTTIDIVYQKVKSRSLVTTIDIVYQKSETTVLCHKFKSNCIGFIIGYYVTNMGLCPHINTNRQYCMPR
jgi:hypothetical protein